MKKYIVILVLFIINLGLLAQEVTQKLEKPSKLFVGTPFKLHLEIVTAPKDTIYAPKLDSLDVFFLMGEPEQEEIIEDDTKKNMITLTFQAFDTGEYTFPSLEFLVKNADKEKVINTRDFVVIINSVVPDTAAVIRDIAKPVTIKLGFWDYVLPVIAIIILIFIIKFLIKLLRKPEEEIQKPVITDTRPPYEKAYKLLKQLMEENLLDKGEFIEFYFRLSVILRFFIEEHYKINALEMTTSEIRRNLILSDKQEKSKILKLLRESDKVKFAKFIPDRAQTEKFAVWLEAYLISFKQRKTGVKENV